MKPNRTAPAAPARCWRRPACAHLSAIILYALVACAAGAGVRTGAAVQAELTLTNTLYCAVGDFTVRAAAAEAAATPQDILRVDVAETQGDVALLFVGDAAGVQAVTGPSADPVPYRVIHLSSSSFALMIAGAQCSSVDVHVRTGVVALSSVMSRCVSGGAHKHARAHTNMHAPTAAGATTRALSQVTRQLDSLPRAAAVTWVSSLASHSSVSSCSPPSSWRSLVG